MMQYPDRLCFLDFETTGINVFIDEPIQIGAVLINTNLEIEQTFLSYIRLPSKDTYDELLKRYNNSFKIHGIPLETIEYAPSQKLVICDFFEQFGTDYRFINWNIGFDNDMLKKMCYFNNEMETYNKVNYRLIDLQTICYTLKLRGIIPMDVNSMQDVADHFFIPRQKYHDALNCAKVALEIYKKFLGFISKRERFYNA